jgi:biopolymer transport protein ExbB
MSRCSRFSLTLQRVAWLVLAAATAPLNLLAQTNEAAGTAAAEGGQSVSAFDLVFVKGGVFMYFILLVSVVMVYLVIDAFLIVRKSKLIPQDVLAELKEAATAHDAEKIVSVCEENPAPLTRIIGAGFRVIKRGHTALEETLAEHGAREASAIRTRLSYLNTIATIAPMLGLLGTVSGMIKAFGNIAIVGMGKASLLANNISEALVTTAGGLIVAIPAMALFFYFRNRVNDMMVEVEDAVGEVVETYGE